MSLRYWAETPEGSLITVSRIDENSRRRVQQGVTAKSTKTSITIDLLHSDETIKVKWPKIKEILIDTETSIRWMDEKTGAITRVVRADLLNPSTKIKDAPTKLSFSGRVH